MTKFYFLDKIKKENFILWVKTESKKRVIINDKI